MRLISLLAILMLALGCSKKDVRMIRQYLNKNACTAISINPDSVNTNDLYMIKTFSDNGLLSHFKAQVGDIYNNQFQFDYDISYERDKAIFQGSTKVFQWVLDVIPEDPDAPQDPNAPTHPEEIVELRDTRNFEILLDIKTHYPIEVKYVQSGESLLQLTYDHRNFLKKLVVNGSWVFNVTTDNSGNILSILTPPLVEEEPYYGPQQLGLWYRYSNTVLPKGASQYYETPTIFISTAFSMVELLNWGPFQPHLERVHVTLQHGYGEEYLPSTLMDADYFNHQYDQDGNLIKYDFQGDIRRELPYQGTLGKTSVRSIAWKCSTKNNQ